MAKCCHRQPVISVFVQHIVQCKNRLYSRHICRGSAAGTPHAARQPRAGLDGGVGPHRRMGLGFVWPGGRPAAANQLTEPAQSPSMPDSTVVPQPGVLMAVTTMGGVWGGRRRGDQRFLNGFGTFTLFSLLFPEWAQSERGHFTDMFQSTSPDFSPNPVLTST